MSKTESWKFWGGLFAALIAFGLFTAIWPTISGSLNLGFGGGPSTRLPNETHPIIVELPPIIQVPGLELGSLVSIPGPEITVSLPEIDMPGAMTVNSQMIVFEQPIVAVIIVAVLVIGLVLPTGGALGGIYVLVARWVARTEEQAAYQEHKAALDQKEKEKLKVLQANRAAASPPEEPGMPRWSAISTGLLVILFVIFGGMVLTATFYPEQLIEIGDDLLRPASLIIGIPLLITTAVLVFAPRWGTAVLAITIMLFVALATLAVLDIAGMADTRPLPTLINIIGLVQVITLVILGYLWQPKEAVVTEKATPAVAKQGSGIPYDGIVVLLTGLIIVGLGLGMMVLINSPYYEQIEQLLGLG